MEETTIWQDIWDYIYGVYLSVDGNYENLGYGSNTIISIRMVVLGLFIGMIIACVAMAYNKQILGGFVRKLLSGEVNSAEKAKRLDELGYNKNPLIRSAARKSVSLRRVVRCVEEDEFYAKQNEELQIYEKKREEHPELPKFKEQEYLVDTSSEHFYIPESMCDMAEQKFYSGGSTWTKTILMMVLFCIGFFILLLVLPKILNLVDDFVGSFGSKDPYRR
jgi:hypothetical protein